MLDYKSYEYKYQAAKEQWKKNNRSTKYNNNTNVVGYLKVWSIITAPRHTHKYTKNKFRQGDPSWKAQYQPWPSRWRAPAKADNDAKESTHQ